MQMCKLFQVLRINMKQRGIADMGYRPIRQPVMHNKDNERLVTNDIQWRCDSII